MPSELATRTPMEMIQVAFDAAINQGGALEVVDRILEQQKWMIQHQEELEFNAALQRIQSKLKTIPRRGYNDSTRSSYALVEDIDNEIQVLLQQEGMTLSFTPEASPNPEEVVVVGILSLGAYSRRYPLPMPADGKGAKGGGVMTRTHATGSAITYGKRYIKNMIFDLRFKEKDDDGNAAGTTPQNAIGMKEERLVEIVTNMEAALNKKDLFRIQNAAIGECTKLGDMMAQRDIMKAYDKRMAQLEKK